MPTQVQASPGPWSRRCEHHPAGSGGRGSDLSGLLTARSCAGRRSRPCEWATLSRSAAGGQTSDCSQTDRQTDRRCVKTAQITAAYFDLELSQ